MVRRIDQSILWLLALFCLFIVFMVMTDESIPLSACLAAVACLLSRSLIRRLKNCLRGKSRKARRQYARAQLSDWLLLPENEIEEKVCALLGASFNSEEELIVLLFPPDSSALNGDLVLSHWRAHRGESRITLAAFCKAEESARDWARKLENPGIQLFDGDSLEVLLMKTCRVVPGSFVPEQKKHPGLKEIVHRLAIRTNPVKAGAYAAVTLALYFLSGRLFYLAAFGILLTMTALCLYRRRFAA